MASKIRRRSGNAFTEYMQLIDWKPKFIILAGVGVQSEETAVFRETWGSDFELYGFEPSVDAYNSVKNDFPGIIRNYALWNQNCTKTLHVKPGWKDGSSLFENNDDQAKRKQETIVCRTLDSLFAFPSTFNKGALWLDVEGAELQALQGAEGLIKCIDAVNVEMTSVPRGNDWSTPYAVHQWLTDHHFKQFAVHTIRPCIGQRDAIYLHRRIWNIRFTHCF